MHEIDVDAVDISLQSFPSHSSGHDVAQSPFHWWFYTDDVIIWSTTTMYA